MLTREELKPLPEERRELEKIVLMLKSPDNEAKQLAKSLFYASDYYSRIKDNELNLGFTPYGLSTNYSLVSKLNFKELIYLINYVLSDFNTRTTRKLYPEDKMLNICVSKYISLVYIHKI